jgi:acetyltransferase-like isoleucine patch superfamily enzyme
MRQTAPDVALQIGPGAEIDETVLLGYKSGRPGIAPTLRIGDDAHIRSGSVIYAGSTIGARLQTGHGVVIREENRVGDDLWIWSNSVLDYGCEIGSHVHIHCNVYVAQFTVLEDDVFLAPGVMIANDPHPGCPQFRKCMRGPTLRRGAKIGIGVCILPFVEIGERALIGGGSVVTRDIPEGVVAYGNPARPMRRVEELTCPFGFTAGPYRGDRGDGR